METLLQEQIYDEMDTAGRGKPHSLADEDVELPTIEEANSYRSIV